MARATTKATRSNGSAKTRKTSTTKKPAAGKAKTRTTSTRRSKQEVDDDEDEEPVSESGDDGDDDAYENNEEEEDDAKSEVASLHSDALDDSDFDAPASRGKKRKRGSAASSPKKVVKAKSSPVKKQRKSKAAEAEDEDDDLEDGQEVVGVVVQAPKTGRVPPGQISQNTLDFLTQLQDPECNDRTWCSLPLYTSLLSLKYPVWRQTEKEWKDFLEKFTDLLCEADEEIPPLPPNDVLHRIYRDIRFSNNKTPYKTNLSASFSRSGRKGTFAHLKPGGGSIIAGGSWCPEKGELQKIRNHILHNPRRLREVISSREFVRLFGEAKPHPKGKRQSIFGHEDELKNAPKGVAKDHPDIDLLKCKSIAVVHYVPDEDVLAPNFNEKIIETIHVLRPLVHLLNEMMTTEPGDLDDDVEAM
ncbi:hypothetical protein SCHPADRAFT_834923 [Schizopora paradoxa]|uniref:Uncharacterized protein n=1 Tax=Schizopora paradoxa TaxID=27342 RepID=A0A0H2RA72_9AGAM|nr:hypothetical protein SCHPADRAFT_834923 [Schizopora paradoxa]